MTLFSGLLLLAILSSLHASTDDMYQEVINYNPKAGYEWRASSVGTIPYGCSFVFGGSWIRMNLVGRIQDKEGNILPVNICHYGPKGSETFRTILYGEIFWGNGIVDWLCSNNTVGWTRVNNFNPGTIKAVKPLAVGWNSTSRQPIYACKCHSFFADSYPASVGHLIDNKCYFENKTRVSYGVITDQDLNWWHTSEVLTVRQLT